MVVYIVGSGSNLNGVFIVVREREKAQKKIQEYLETELEARTRVVMKQKERLSFRILRLPTV